MNLKLISFENLKCISDFQQLSSCKQAVLFLFKKTNT